MKICLSIKLVTVLLLCNVIQTYAYSERNLLQQQASFAELKSVLVTDQKWITLPTYKDRLGWETLLNKHSKQIIKNGESQLTYVWQVIKATDYLEFERTGNRYIMQKPNTENANALSQLLLAELAEGKGRFIDQLINGVFYFCEMSSWSLSAHMLLQPSKRSLPEVDYPVFDLGAGTLSSLLSWTYYFFHKEFDKVNPEISRRLYNEINKRIMIPYLENDNFRWMAINYKEGQVVNNWNPWCNCNALQTFMLLEKDKDRLGQAVYRSMVSVDKFFNYVHKDGACEEGPSYWRHAAGKALDYLQLLSAITNEKINLFQHKQIKDMGEYICNSYVGNGWVVNFSDAPAKGGIDPYLIFRYGKMVHSKQMKSFAASFNDIKQPRLIDTDFFRLTESLRIEKELGNSSKDYKAPEFCWYPETEFCYLRNDKCFFAAKGGHNRESHNHNDVGTFSLWIDNTPLIIDAGVGTYTSKTFSKQRYSIWTMQSDYHNLPMINGIPQRYGREFRATDVEVSTKSFKANIATAYPNEANVEQWYRNYYLKKNMLIIEDSFKLKATTNYNKINFLSWGNIQIHDSFVEINTNGIKGKIKYDSKIFKAYVETIELTDPRLSNIWGNKIYRLSFISKTKIKQGKYKFSILF